MNYSKPHDKCPHCGVELRKHLGLRCYPATDLELHKMRRAREQGKAPKISWYHPPKLPPAFKPDLSQQFPPSVRAMFTRQSDPSLDWTFPTANDNLADYIREFESLNNLVPVPVTWVKTDGNFA